MLKSYTLALACLNFRGLTTKYLANLGRFYKHGEVAEWLKAQVC